MTGRERLSAILHKKPKDRLSCTALVDNATLQGLPPRLRGNGGIDFYRYLGADIFLLNGWGTSYEFKSPELRWPDHVEETVRRSEDDPDITVTEWQTGQGKLISITRRGHVRDLLGLIKETECDGIHALTPPPTGNTPWEMALDALGEDLIIIGCLDPTLWISGKIDAIGPALDRMITPRLCRANFVLALFADGITVPLERFEAVKQWMGKRGEKQSG